MLHGAVWPLCTFLYMMQSNILLLLLIIIINADVYNIVYRVTNMEKTL